MNQFLLTVYTFMEHETRNQLFNSKHKFPKTHFISESANNKNDKTLNQNAE